MYIYIFSYHYIKIVYICKEIYDIFFFMYFLNFFNTYFKVPKHSIDNIMKYSRFVLYVLRYYLLLVEKKTQAYYWSKNNLKSNLTLNTFKIYFI